MVTRNFLQMQYLITFFQSQAMVATKVLSISVHIEQVLRLSQDLPLLGAFSRQEGTILREFY